MKSFLTPRVFKSKLFDATAWQATLAAAKVAQGSSPQIRRVVDGMEIDQNLARTVAPGMGSSLYAPQHAGGVTGMLASGRDGVHGDRGVSVGQPQGAGPVSPARAAINELIQEFFLLMKRFEPVGQIRNGYVFGNVVMVDGSPVHVRVSRDSFLENQLRVEIYSPLGYVSFAADSSDALYGPGTTYHQLATRVLEALRQRLATPGYPLPPHTKRGLDPSEYRHTAPLYESVVEKLDGLPAMQVAKYGEFVAAVAKVYQALEGGHSRLTGNEGDWSEMEACGVSVPAELKDFFDATDIDKDNDFVIDFATLVSKDRPHKHGVRLNFGRGVRLNVVDDFENGGISLVVHVDFIDRHGISKQLKVAKVFAEAGFRVLISESQRQQAVGDEVVPYEHCGMLDDVTVTAAQLEPEKFVSSQARYADLVARSEALAPLTTMPMTEFVPIVARLVKQLSPMVRSDVTGEETSWEELRGHRGLYGSDFAWKFQGTIRDGVRTIDLSELGQTTTYDRGFEPILGDFAIIPTRDEQSGRVAICLFSRSDEHSLEDLFRAYDILLAAGIPVAPGEPFIQKATGSEKLKLKRNDPRLAQATIDMPSAVSRILADDEQSVLEDF